MAAYLVPAFALVVIAVGIACLVCGVDFTLLLREPDADQRTASTIALSTQPTLRPITSDGSHYLDHVSDLSRLRAYEHRRELQERSARAAQVGGSARLSARSADAPEGVTPVKTSEVLRTARGFLRQGRSPEECAFGDWPDAVAAFDRANWWVPDWWGLGSLRSTLRRMDRAIRYAEQQERADNSGWPPLPEDLPSPPAPPPYWENPGR